MKSTLKRESKARETVKMETIKVRSVCMAINALWYSTRMVVNEMSKSVFDCLSVYTRVCTCCVCTSTSVGLQWGNV